MKEYEFGAIEKKWQEIWEEQKGRSMPKTARKSPSFMPWLSSPIPRGRACTWGIPAPIPRWTSSPASAAWRATTSCIPWAGTPSACRRRTMPSRTTFIPKIVTRDNIARFKSQLQALGLSFDWNREINTTDPELLQVDPVDLPAALISTAWPIKRRWRSTGAPPARCVLANEEVVDGVCERCGSEVVQQGQEPVDAQDHRICPAADRRSGRGGLSSTGSKSSRKTGSAAPPARRSTFSTTAGDILTVYTTRPDTLFGATYMVMSPEHPYVEKWADRLAESWTRSRAYRSRGGQKVRL